MSIIEVFTFIVGVLTIILAALEFIWCIIGICILLNWKEL